MGVGSAVRVGVGDGGTVTVAVGMFCGTVTGSADGTPSETVRMASREIRMNCFGGMGHSMHQRFF